MIEPPAPPEASAGWRRWLPWSTAAAALLVAVAAIAWRIDRPAKPALLQRIDIDLGMGFQAHPASARALLSPDGSRIVFLGSDDGAAADLFVRPLDAAIATPLHTGRSTEFFFSPTGNSIGFVKDGKLWKRSLDGGPPVELCAATDGAVRGADWGDGGFIVAALGPSAGLVRIPDAGGAPAPLTTLDASRGEVTHRWPQVLPGSRAVVFTSHTFAGRYDDATIEAVSLATGERKTLQLGGYYGRYLPSGHLVFVRHHTLYAAPMDPGSLKLTGPPVPVLDPVLADEELGRLPFTFSSAGEAFVLTGTWREPKSVPSWRDQSGPSTPLPMPAENYGDPRVSPDGRQVAVSAQQALLRQIIVYDAENESPVRLGSDTMDLMPLWAPDGRHLVFASDADRGIYNLYWRRADGAGGIERLTRGPNVQYPSSFSPDGRLLAYMEMSPTTAIDIWLAPLDLGDPDHPITGEPRPLLQTTASEEGPAFSPDGKWLAYSSTESGRAEIYVRAMSAAAGQWQVSRRGGMRPVWSRDGRRIFFDRENQAMVVDVTAGAIELRRGHAAHLGRAADPVARRPACVPQLGSGAGRQTDAGARACCQPGPARVADRGHAPAELLRRTSTAGSRAAIDSSLVADGLQVRRPCPADAGRRRSGPV